MRSSSMNSDLLDFTSMKMLDLEDDEKGLPEETGDQAIEYIDKLIHNISI